MKPEHLELLIFTNTRFASKEFSEKTNHNTPHPQSEHEKLVEACWNGLFREMLPELSMEPGHAKELTLWNVTEGNHFLELDYAVQPQEKEKFTAVNPYLFLQSQIFS